MSATATTATTLVKKTLGWSIFLSVLMIVAGLLAIIIPLIAGIAVTIFVGWLLVFSGVMHFAYAWYTRGAGGILCAFLRLMPLLNVAKADSLKTEKLNGD